MESYYTCNKLKINTDKTQTMLAGKNKPNRRVILKGKSIKNESNIKILGTIFSDGSKIQQQSHN